MSFRTVLYLCLLCVAFILAWFLFTRIASTKPYNSEFTSSTQSLSTEANFPVQSKPESYNRMPKKTSANTSVSNNIASRDNSATSHISESTSLPPVVPLPPGTPAPRELTIDEEVELLSLFFEYHDKNPSIIGIVKGDGDRVYPLYGATLYITRHEALDENGDVVWQSQTSFGNVELSDDGIVPSGTIPSGTRVFELDHNGDIIAEYIQSDSPWDYITSRGLDPEIYYGFNQLPYIDAEFAPGEMDYYSTDIFNYFDFHRLNDNLNGSPKKHLEQTVGPISSEIKPPKPPVPTNTLPAWLSDGEAILQPEDFVPEKVWTKPMKQFSPDVQPPVDPEDLIKEYNTTRPRPHPNNSKP